MIVGEFNRIEPEFAGHSFPANVNMWRFIAIEAVEIEAVWSRDVLDSRHTVDSIAGTLQQGLEGQ